MNSQFKLASLTLAAAAMLSACGGGSNASSDDAPPARGTLELGLKAGAATAAQIDAGTAAKGVQAISGKAACDVDVRYVYYWTRDPQGLPATASAAVLVPAGTGANCTGNRPVVLYAHGTTTDQAFNMADIQNNAEGSLVAAFYAAQGFIVVAPNYMGYDRSGLQYTPYLNAESSAMDMVDGLRAAKTHLNAESAVKPSAKLLLAGYSQGGHVAMATQKVIERDYASEFTVTAAAPMSGPYNLVKFGDVINTTGPVNAGATLFLPLMLTSYQKAYGNIYSTPSDVYQSPYDKTSETLFPSKQSIAQLIAAGKLPNDPTFTKLFGTGGLLTDSFKTGYLGSNFRKALQTNTLLGWTPKAPVALCGGANDPTVFFFNTTDAQLDFGSRGKAVPASNLESAASMSWAGSVTAATIAGGFAQAKAATSAAAGGGTAGAAAVQGAYHGTLVPPFCNALARGFFQSVLAAQP
ncbi:lipase family protein [Mitsuaria sp. GD03876]|uniref:alpha/beta hydrolase n=1 Tax=Mitsuaria sp. GD03876 TaxID=2975399 RepID=UPI00244887BF|nr:lipase family protein [Mitsuaria sp. GD03876]MDH0865453.1 cutinase family protein [Mitsuaria sp. GD03876]